MKEPKGTNNQRRDGGITLVSLVITIVLVFIVSTTAVYTSMDRFEINKYNKMINDLELLSAKVSNYYLKYDGLPVLRDSSNNPIKYTYTELDFNKNINDNENYYILDLNAIGNISLNYGEEGFNNPNTTDDVYIINENTHQIYYVQGIEMNDIIYYAITNNEKVVDTIPPSKPEITIISGTKNESGIYITPIKIEIMPGKDTISGVEETTYSISANGTIIVEETEITNNENNVIELKDDLNYEITVKSKDLKGNVSENVQNIELNILRVADIKGQVMSTTSNTIVYDEYGNRVVIPPSFMISEEDNTDNAVNVTQGIVIEDGTATETDGSLFVWVPVGKVYDSANTYKTITLGRYYFDGTNTILRQPLPDAPYTSNVEITISNKTYVEYQPTTQTNNEKAININKFCESAIKNGGYYIGRYEARDGKVTYGEERDESTGVTHPMVYRLENYTYNWVTQEQAAILCRNMYPKNNNFTTDLTNSYAWDTAIKFIQTFGDESYADKKTVYKEKLGYGTVFLTEEEHGTNPDKACNIYDMASSMFEWSTETNINTDSESEMPCVYRGGCYHYPTVNSMYRWSDTVDATWGAIAFRSMLYLN